MRWITTALLAVLVLSGCRSSQYPAADPFASWGLRRVPPPPTGSLGTPGTANPYYTPAPAATGSPMGMQTLLVGVGALDPFSLGVSAVLLVLAAVAASLVPAIQAARVDPARSLRSE